MNKKEMVYENIKKRIIDGTFAPGLPINENEFAQDLNVSKTPVRESLRQLEREGFVENIPGRGSAVTHITFQDIRDIFTIREIIECGSVKKATLICDETDIIAKKRELESYFNKRSENEVSAWGPEEDVHQFIINCIGNKKLVETYKGLLDHIKRIRLCYSGRLSQKRSESMFSEHNEILDALLERNPDRAERAVQNHLSRAAAYLLGLTFPEKG